jgi:hypothetical protein
MEVALSWAPRLCVTLHHGSCIPTSGFCSNTPHAMVCMPRVAQPLWPSRMTWIALPCGATPGQPEECGESAGARA